MMTRMQAAKVGAAVLFLGTTAYFLKNPRMRRPAKPPVAAKLSDTPQRVLDSDTPQRVLTSDTPQRVLTSDTPQRVMDSDTPQRALLSDTPQRRASPAQERPECAAAKRDAGERLKGLSLADGAFWSLPRGWSGAAGVVYDEAAGQPIGFFRTRAGRLALYDLWGAAAGTMAADGRLTDVVSAASLSEGARARLRSAVPPSFPASGRGALPASLALASPRFAPPASSRLGRDRRGAAVCLWRSEGAVDVVVLNKDGGASAAWTKLSPELYEQAKALNGWPN